MQVSVAYQGGGAKVIELISVARAFQKLEAADNQFYAFRVSGASAGAIAAAMHATGCKIQDVIQKSEEIEKLVRKNFSSNRLSRWNILRRFALGKAIFDESALTNIILRLFLLGGVNAQNSIRALVTNRELRILRSDIQTHASEPANEKSETPLIEALVDSCAIPFAIRVPGPKNRTPYILDGGLFQNLPAREALKDLSSNQHALGISFERAKDANLQNVSFGRYAFAVLESLLAERIGDSIERIGEANIIRLPSRHRTFDFESVFEGNFVTKFNESVEDTATRIERWRQNILNLGGPDWLSTNPRDILVQVQKTQSEILDFIEKIGEITFDADFVHHEVIFRSGLAEQIPDIYNLHIKLLGNKNEGLQFLRFHFYDSEVGPLKRTRIEVKSAQGNRCNAMMLPIQQDRGKRVTSIFLCLERPLRAGDEVTITKTEESFLGMSEYVRTGFIAETLGIGPRKCASELRVSVQFPKGHEPAHVRDASRNNSAERAKLDEEAGKQILTGTAQSTTSSDGGTIYTSIAKLTEPASHRRFVKVIYDKGRAS